MTRAVQTCVSRTPLRHQWPCQPRLRQQWRIPRDSRGRNNSPGSPGNTFAVHSAAQLQTPTGSLCLKTVWDNCVGSTARPVCTVAQSDRGGVAGATPAGSILLSANFALGTSSRTDGSRGIRTQRPAVWQLGGNFLRAPNHSPLPNCPIRGVVLADRDNQLLSGLRQASAPAMCCLSIRHGLGRKSRRSRERSTTVVACSLLESPRGVDRNSQLKQRLHLWEAEQVSVLIGKVLGQQNSRPLRRTARRVQPHTDEQRGKRECALRARSSISKAMKGLVGGAAEGSVDCRTNWNTALIPRGSGIGTHPTSAERRGGANRLARKRYKLGRSAMREQGRSKTGTASLPHVKLSPVSALVLLANGRNTLDAIVSFAGAGLRRRLFHGLDILTIKCAAGDPEECRFLLNAQLMFLKKEKDPTSKEFDDDEWIRSLAGAQEVTTDVPEDSVTYGQQHVDPKKVRPIQMGEFLRKYVSRRLLALSEAEIAALTSMRQIGVGTPGGADALAIFRLLQNDEWMTGSLSGPLARIKVDEQNCFGMIEWQARGGVAVSPQAHAAATWKHRNLSCVEQEGLPPMPKDRGAEQGDVVARWCAAWPWAWWRLRREEALPHGKRRVHFLGLA